MTSAIFKNVKTICYSAHATKEPLTDPPDTLATDSPVTDSSPPAAAESANTVDEPVAEEGEAPQSSENNTLSPTTSNGNTSAADSSAVTGDHRSGKAGTNGHQTTDASVALTAAATATGPSFVGASSTTSGRSLSTSHVIGAVIGSAHTSMFTFPELNSSILLVLNTSREHLFQIRAFEQVTSAAATEFCTGSQPSCASADAPPRYIRASINDTYCVLLVICK